MRTFWLIGEDDSRIRMRSQETTNVPDLVSREQSSGPNITTLDTVLNASIDRFQAFVQQRSHNSRKNSATQTRSKVRSMFRQTSVPVDILCYDHNGCEDINRMEC